LHCNAWGGAGRCTGAVYARGVGKAGDWLREERRKTLGDWVSVCVACGHAQRYFDESEANVPEVCPQCGGAMRSRCPSCSARFSSVFAVECEVCGASLREAELHGVPIRKRQPDRLRKA
jgi:ribosomal protein S27E